MTLQAFENWLNNYLNFEKTQTKNIFWLDSMKFLAEKLGNPQDQIKCIHVAGSKGKGSITSMISSIVEATGKKCGFYTSPHITDFRERISSPQGFFADSVYEKSADQLTAVVDSIPASELPGGRGLTWFELVTVFAFLCFKNADCDFVVYETGLGGRLDSTNIVKPILSILMPIELEHTEFLGDTIEKIAFEKAGIIKNNTPSLVSFQNYEEAEKVFSTKASEMNSELIFSKDYEEKLSYSYDNSGKMKVSFKLKNYDHIFNATLKLCGEVQAKNAFTACLAVKKVLPEISDSQIEAGLENAYLPGRFEIVNHNENTIILDGAHTVKSISNTIQTLKEIFPENNTVLIFACAGDKDIKDIIPLFKSQFTEILFTKPETVRFCNPEMSMKICQENKIHAKIIPDLKEAFQTAENLINGQKNSTVLVTGSFYLVSETKNLISKKD